MKILGNILRKSNVTIKQFGMMVWRNIFLSGLRNSMLDLARLLSRTYLLQSIHFMKQYSLHIGSWHLKQFFWVLFLFLLPVYCKNMTVTGYFLPSWAVLLKEGPGTASTNIICWRMMFSMAIFVVFSHHLRIWYANLRSVDAWSASVDLCSF